MSVPGPARLRLAVRGAVQGVGFRPFVYRLAHELGLAGWVNNSPQGVALEVEGAGPRLEEFLLRLEREKPPRSSIQSLEASWLDPAGGTGFEIRASDAAGARQTLVMPDIATCPDCLREVLDPANRRFRYPFTNCTNCGPRFSIVEALPYDRAHTSMRGFAMCDTCRAEYDDPLDRRFHAQPNACPACGPALELWDPAGLSLADREAALSAAVRALRGGAIVALKGLGGFQLLVAARDDDAVHRLRERKQREEKPFAVMFPTLADLASACEISPPEERLLRSAEAPIVLLRARRPSPLSAGVAPGNPLLGALLPTTPLHHLLLRELGAPVVATSGNRSDEPICTDEREALRRLAGLADFFLVHNRPIVRHVDDSIVRVMAGRELVLRRARGYAPLPITLPPPEQGTARILAVGAHLKNTVAFSLGAQVFISQHLGDLENAETLAAFQRAAADLPRLYETQPTLIAADAHPDYLSTQFARRTGLPLARVQHHLAHVLSCMAENELEPPVLGVAWDGTGFGLDGTIWGGEFLRVTAGSDGNWAWSRVAHLRPFRLPGGDAAVKEPRRAALGLLFEAWGEAAFEQSDLAPLRAFLPAELVPLRQMLTRGVHAPFTTSAGRLFDAVASLAGLRQVTRFEGQSAMDLEFAADGIETEAGYPLPIADCPAPPAPQSADIRHPAPMRLDWQPLLEAVLADVRHGTPVGLISAQFHRALADGIVAVARSAGVERVALTGGCFQNRRLLEQTVARLTSEGFRPYWHQRVPPNDGGLALGQVFAALRSLATT